MPLSNDLIVKFHDAITSADCISQRVYVLRTWLCCQAPAGPPRPSAGTSPHPFLPFQTSFPMTPRHFMFIFIFRSLAKPHDSAGVQSCLHTCNGALAWCNPRRSLVAEQRGLGVRCGRRRPPTVRGKAASPSLHRVSTSAAAIMGDWIFSIFSHYSTGSRQPCV